MLSRLLMMGTVTEDSCAKRRRRDCVIERIETMPMTAQQYEQAVNALATLIVESTMSRQKSDSVTSDHSDVD
ncbi:hypothetical protein [Amycolatopsis alkalitolerans]|uniref:Uncharacterized protein n=1 Tax=Amycolatopsis alkalitolerans TaxID=2547244 RepID=A0A5C4LXM4_9PSEU|nr:hypothetical protein [Amycolatopsis alkalitolerans]TNC23748.1 hypothetical protein FG385_20520 [Amycolatopsis alkalitolerans]